MPFSQFAPADVIVDFGTASTRVFVKGKGIVVNEPSIVAMLPGERRIVAVGEEAERLFGRSGEKLKLENPIRSGKVTDFDNAQLMLQYFLNKALGNLHRKPRIIGMTPVGMSDLELSMLLSVFDGAGCRKRTTVEQVVASGVGSGLSIYEPQGSFVVDIGAGKTEMALLSMGGVVVSHTVDAAGNAMDDGIVAYIKREYDIEITKRAAEQIRFDMIDIRPTENINRKIIIRGRDAATSMPTMVDVSLEGIAQAVCVVVERIIESVQTALGKTPPELCRDVLKNGITLCGGCSQLPKIDTLIAEAVGVPVHIATDGGDSSVLGAGYIADRYDVFSDVAAGRE